MEHSAEKRALRPFSDVVLAVAEIDRSIVEKRLQHMLFGLLPFGRGFRTVFELKVETVARWGNSIWIAFPFPLENMVGLGEAD